MKKFSKIIFIGMISAIAAVLPISASANLVTNGDFESGNTGFISDYTFSSGNIFGASTYDIVTDPKNSHSSATSYGDHTSGSGNMMAVNGSTTAGDVVWRQDISVTENTQYDFAAYISSWVSGSPAELKFSVNDQIIGDLKASSTTGVWDLFFSTWQSGTNDTAKIEIVNSNTAFGGNDFSLDDIYFGNPVFSGGSPVSAPSTILLIIAALFAYSIRHRRFN